MKSITILYILAGTIFFLPLSHSLGDSSFLSPITWNKFEWILVPLIAWSFWNRPISQTLKSMFKIVVHKSFLAITFLLAISIISMSGLSVSWSEWLRLALVVATLPALFLIFSQFPWKVVILVVVAVATLHAQWALLQFSWQHDVGLYVIGESRLSATLPGVAKFAAESGKLIRPYGPYSHANSLAGIMAMGLFLSALLMLQCSMTQRKILFPIVVLLFLTLLITYSRASYVSALLLFIPLCVWRLPALRQKIWLRLGLLFLLIILVLLPLIIARTTDLEDLGITERLHGLTLAVTILPTKNWWHGFGLGQYTFHLEKYLMSKNIVYQAWQIVPVHNVPLLIVSEWGLLPTILFMGIMTMLVDVRTLVWLLPFLPLILFDHYLITQSAPLFWLFLTWQAIQKAPKLAQTK